jgi:hypothetical protein
MTGVLSLGLGIVAAEGQLPNAWRINDNSTASGSTLSYVTNLTTAQFDAATTTAGVTP